MTGKKAGRSIVIITSTVGANLSMIFSKPVEMWSTPDMRETIGGQLLDEYHYSKSKRTSLNEALGLPRPTAKFETAKRLASSYALLRWSCLPTVRGIITSDQPSQTTIYLPCSTPRTMLLITLPDHHLHPSTWASHPPRPVPA